ncbi:DUF4159 domain-containing protein [soil metagenome]
MGALQSMTFMAPWALAGLLALPVIWWLLRFTPPKPEIVRFPPLRLLLDLIPREEQPDKTPWWLMLLRLAIAALVIFGVAHPLLAPDEGRTLAGEPLLIVVDDSWAAAKTWDLRRGLIADLAGSAERNGSPVSLATTAQAARPGALAAMTAGDARSKAAALEPKALDPDRPALLERLKPAFAESEPLRIVWVADGLDRKDTRSFAEGLLALNGGRASLEVMTPPASALPVALATPVIDGGRIKVMALRAPSNEASQITARALAGNGRALAETQLTFASGRGRTDALIDLPLEMRNEVERIEIAGERHAGAVYLFDDRWRRKTVSLMAGTSLEAAQPLLSPLYYVSRALEPYTEISQPPDTAGLKERLDAGLSLLLLADIGVLPAEQHEIVAPWVERGGMLVRFAGPRLAAAQDDLIPVSLREGGRSLGSALSWETPQALQAFSDASPFAGIAVDPTITVTRQVLAEPSADLPPKIWASLADGTPLVTAERRGKGMIVLFHVTANADWSNLPVSGMFVDMLRRLLDLAPGAGGGDARATAGDTASAFTPRRVLTGMGDLADPTPDAAPIPAAEIDKTKASAIHPPGLYNRGSLVRAINLSAEGDALVPIGDLPAGATIRGLERAPALALAPYLFAAAFGLFLLDCIAGLWLAGAWQRYKARAAAAAILALMILGGHPGDVRAQQADAGADQFALSNTLQTKLAYVTTGNADVDETSRAGLFGLSAILTERTSVEPGDPVAINVEKDEIVFFPILYWPVLPDAQEPSAAALAKLNVYVKNGGTIFFDTRDDGSGAEAFTGGSNAATLALRRIVDQLDIPPIEPVPPDHVLTKAFYLLQSFPGRYENGQLWVETGEGGTVNAGNADGVTSIIIGSNDYAGAWAQDERHQPLNAVIPGGERQREFAYRAGVNIVMYALTGNYKADQVHVPALLERLGQ